MFKDYLILFTIIIFHEFGHFLVATYYHWQIDKIAIYPFGGCVSFNEDLNRPLKEELFIMLAGPLFQVCLYVVIIFLFFNKFISLKTYLIFKNYHYSLLLFNLLPIYHLDGGKLINIINNYFFSYKKSFKLSIYNSYLTFIFGFIFIMFFYKNLNLLSMFIFLICKVIIENKKLNYLYNKFLLERYMKNYYFSKEKIINNKDKMCKEYRHIIKSKNHFQTEKEYLKERFNNEKK